MKHKEPLMLQADQTSTSTNSSTAQVDPERARTIWRPSHHLKSNGQAKYVLGLGMLPKLYRGRVHVLAKTPRMLK